MYFTKEPKLCSTVIIPYIVKIVYIIICLEIKGKWMKKYIKDRLHEMVFQRLT